MIHRLTTVLVAFGILLGLVFIVGSVSRLVISANFPAHTVLYPLPHQIPSHPGGISFRFAMVHDAVHDRYPRHGNVYYQERNRRILAAIEKNKDTDGLPPPDQFSLIDDLGVGLDTLGKSDEATRWLRFKLKAQEKLGLRGKALYTSCANLGTFIIHGNAGKAMKGDQEAQERVREGLRYLHKSIEVNPEAHFGREIWQAIIGEFMLAASKNPDVLLEFDMIGNSLKDGWERTDGPHSIGAKSRSSNNHLVRAVAAYLKNPTDVEQAKDMRSNIASVGPAGERHERMLPSWKRVPFDEPCLGIIGMWRLGGGASPHFALALGETMTRVGQRHLAWSAYQRAIREAKRFSSDEAIRTKFINHCKDRQLNLGLGGDETKELTERFDSELRIGQGYQNAYQKFEEEQIAAGKDLDDPHFYDAFHAQHGNIATPIGDADFLAVEETKPAGIAATVIFVVGTVVFVAALLLLLWRRGWCTGLK
jgi:hypothetical protein